MSGERGRSGRQLEILLIVVVAVAILIVGVVVLMMRDSNESQSPTSVDVSWTVTPTWNRIPALPQNADPTNEVALYLDVSQPMGGFLPPPNSHERSGFSDVVASVEKHLVSVAGSGADLRWYPVGKGVGEMHLGTPRLSRNIVFREHETQLAPALEQMTQTISNGNFAAAALITDLNASEGVNGALGALAPLIRWIDQDTVRGGRLDAGLLGVRANYWGVHGHTCPSTGDLACWYSEQQHTYLPLHRVAQAAFYVLILARAPDTVQEIANRVRRDTARLKLTMEWELLTAASRERVVKGVCTVSEPARPGEPRQQLTLMKDSAGWSCVQDQPVELHCALPPETVLERPTSVTNSWQKAATVHDSRLTISIESAATLRIVLDCAALRDRLPPGDLTVQFSGHVPESGGASAGHWQDWTCADDSQEADLGRTPQLADLVNRIRLRPSLLWVRSTSLLRMSTVHD